MYVLEGLRDYMVSVQWQAGDIVTFYRIEPEKKLVMGLRKTCASVSPYEESVRACVEWIIVLDEILSEYLDACLL
ncbi:hypothetical protein CsSME_00018507 [Camellia sinensis var. sinensis]